MKSPTRRRLALVVAPLTLVALAAPAADAKSRRPVCQAGYQWTSDRGGFVPTFRDSAANQNSTALRRTFTVDTTRSVGRTGTKAAEAEVSGGFPVLQASVKAQFEQTTSSQVEVKRGFKEEVTIPAYKRVVYRRGVNVRKLRGLVLAPVDPNFIGPVRPVPGLPDCKLQLKRRISATIPTYSGTKITSSRLKRP